ncbi:hypothetical protein [Niabella beijingensis]|uniref:hypothetical protein n=1 Tax=Niabella beijingensis TaxID=2872700 RepID=UPI001CBCEE74|nr:hypothetical protein [Niabella beijingensis]MBZ4192655.1 hypothetical protein [Niabella beijingensis]
MNTDNFPILQNLNRFKEIKAPNELPQTIQDALKRIFDCYLNENSSNVNFVDGKIYKMEQKYSSRVDFLFLNYDLKFIYNDHSKKIKDYIFSIAINEACNFLVSGLPRNKELFFNVVNEGDLALRIASEYCKNKDYPTEKAHLQLWHGTIEDKLFWNIVFTEKGYKQKTSARLIQVDTMTASIVGEKRVEVLKGSVEISSIQFD